MPKSFWVSRGKQFFEIFDYEQNNENSSLPHTHVYQISYSDQDLIGWNGALAWGFLKAPKVILMSYQDINRICANKNCSSPTRRGHVVLG